MNYQELEHDITCIDTGHMRPDFVACYLIESAGEYALVDAGVKLSAPDILAVLKDKGVAPESVRYLMPTHCHLDHAGGVGTILAHTPNAKVVAHPSCAKHLIDPEQLQTAVMNVYGETFYNNHIGGLEPIPQERILLSSEHSTLMLGSRPLELIEAQGHAYHHYVIYDAQSQGVFSGDTLGVSYTELNTDGTLIFPPTTPTQFDPDAWLHTIDMLTDKGITKAYLTHYNQITWSTQISGQLKRRIKDFCIIAKSCKDEPNRKSAIARKLTEYLDHDFTKEQHKILTADVVLCAGGLDYWLDKQAI